VPTLSHHRPRDSLTFRNGTVILEPAHPAIIDHDTWQAAQDIGAEHATSRDPGPAAPPPNAPTTPTGPASFAATAAAG
jgi:hypothetical protein